MKKSITLKLVILILAFSLQLKGSEIEWNTDYSEAKEEAKRRELPLFILFTNTHSCPPCIRLEKTVFTTNAFKDAAQNEFVPVLVDFAELYKSGKPAKREYIIELRQSIGIPDSITYQGWPYLHLLAPDERVLFSGNIGSFEDFDAFKEILK